jgi:predicted acyl esterase
MRVSLLAASIILALLNSTASPAAADQSRPAGETSRLGVGFLIGKGTESLLPLLTRDNDFLEMMLGPGKVRYIRSLAPPARAMCICESLEGVARTVRILEEADIAPERVYIAYNPEPRPPGARQCTPREELDDYLGSLKKARELVKAYGAALVMGPGLIEMAKREELYPELAKHCDIWMIQTQRLQLDLESGEPRSDEYYREQVKRIVAMLRQGNRDIRVFVQIIPLQATSERRETFTAERLTSYLLAVEDLVDAVKIYGGNTELIAEVIERLGAERRPQPARGSTQTEPEVPKRTEPEAWKQTPELQAWKQTEMIEMRDGARLATDVYLPTTAARAEQQGGLAVVLVRTPYDKSGEQRGVVHWREFLLDNGYAFVIQDMRGFYASKTGRRRESGQYDGYDTIEWLARQPWSNGRVGMMGYSHLGAAQYEAAVTQPPHLACAIPAQAPGNYYTDALYPPKFRKADWETILRGPFSANTPVLLNTRIRRQGVAKIDQFDIPMIHSAGWYDFFKEGAIEMFQALQHQAGPDARGTQKLLIGPWGHGGTQEQDLGDPLDLPGGLAYPANARLDWEQQVWLPWFDHWLKGQPTGVMDEPAVRYYLMGDVDDPDAPGNRWVTASDFPPKSEPARYYVHSDHTLNTEAPATENDSLQYEYDPGNPVPTVGRFHARLPVNGPHDQREVESRSDVLVFTTPVLEEPLEIVGQVQAKLWASSDRKDTDFTVKLTDVYPDGRSMIFLDGIVKVRYRNGYLQEELLEPGEVVELDIDLGYIAIVLAPGHRLRVAISSSNFDRWDINPNTGEPYGEHAVTQSLLAERLRVESFRGEPRYTASLVATNTVFMDARHPSHVVLPVPVE